MNEASEARDRATLWRWHAAWLGVLTLGAVAIGYVATRTGTGAEPLRAADAPAPPSADAGSPASQEHPTRVATDPLPDVPAPPPQAVDRSAVSHSDQLGGINAPTELMSAAPGSSLALVTEPPPAPLSPPPSDTASTQPATPDQPSDDQPLLQGQGRSPEARGTPASKHGGVKTATVAQRTVHATGTMRSTAVHAPAAAVAGTGVATPSSSPLIQQRYRVISALADTAWIVDLERPGMALLEIHLNDQVPEIGRIRSISSDGVHWVVATDHGVIRSGDD